MPLNIPLTLMLDKPITTGAIIGDFHKPYHDPLTTKLVEEFLGDLQPDFLIYNGDIADFYQCSVFAKDPSRLSQLQDDLDSVTDTLAYHKKLMPNTNRIYIEGNHEYRFEKFLWRNAPELAHLRSLDIKELLGIDNNGLIYIPYEQGLLINRIFLVIHGDICSVHSGYTAKRMYDKHGGCGIHNHTHRLGSYYKTDRFGTWCWYENGCLCSLDPDWIKNPNWQQGISLVHFTDHKRFWVQQIPIVGHKLLFNNKIYKP